MWFTRSNIFNLPFRKYSTQLLGFFLPPYFSSQYTDRQLYQCLVGYEAFLADSVWHTHPKYAPNVTLFCLGSYSLGKERDLVQFLAFLVRLFFWGNCTGFHLQGPYFSLESFEMRCCQAAATAPSGGTRSYLSKCLLASGGDSGGADTPALPAPGVSAFLLP